MLCLPDVDNELPSGNSLGWLDRSYCESSRNVLEQDVRVVWKLRR